MPSSSERRRRGPDGRFASQGGPTQKMMVRRQGVGQLALLTPAILFGLIGFAVPVCWVAALVLLGILWGAIAVRRQQVTGGRGVFAEIVDVVVDEAKDAADSAKRALPDTLEEQS